MDSNDAYRGNKAAPRRSPTDVTQFSPNKEIESNQEQFVDQNTRTVKVGNGDKYNVGNLVRVGSNTEDTSQVGNPLQSYQRLLLSPVQNPDEGRDRSSMRRYAKKAVVKEVL